MAYKSIFEIIENLDLSDDETNKIIDGLVEEHNAENYFCYDEYAERHAYMFV